MVGTFAMSAGVLLSGLPQFLAQEYGLNQIESIRPLFLLYSIIGVALSGIYYLISNEVEVQVNNNTNRLSKPIKQALSPKSKQIVGKLLLFLL
jgi:hypothetical protein